MFRVSCLVRSLGCTCIVVVASDLCLVTLGAWGMILTIVVIRVGVKTLAGLVRLGQGLLGRSSYVNWVMLGLNCVCRCSMPSSLTSCVFIWLP